eukprot:679387-Amphidinium_carterae.1
MRVSLGDRECGAFIQRNGRGREPFGLADESHSLPHALCICGKVDDQVIICVDALDQVRHADELRNKFLVSVPPNPNR